MAATGTHPATRTRPFPYVEGVTHRFVEVGGLNMHVAEAGDPDAPPLLMLHGWPQHFYMWHKQVPALSREYRLIMPDLRGLGWTDAPPRGYDKQTLGDDMLGLLDVLELQRVRLMAHDWGGWAGYLMCLSQPQRFDRYLALNIPPPWGDTTPRKILGTARMWYQVVNASPWLGKKVVSPDSRYLPTMFERAASRPGTWDKIAIDSYISQFGEPARARASQMIYRTFVTREFFQVARGKFNHMRMQVPTLLLFGEDDFAISKALVIGDHARYADDFKLELVPGTGHFIAEEQPELVTNRALQFMAE